MDACSPTDTDVKRNAIGDRVNRRVLVVSHPAVVSVNQEVYRELAKRGWDVKIVIPSRWSHSYARGTVTPKALPGMEGALPRPTATPLLSHQMPGAV
jgi:hypothetical protein